MNKKIVVILLLAFALRFLVLIVLDRHVNPEKWEYDSIALSLIHHSGYVYNHLGTTYRSFGYPMYPLLTAASHLLTNQNYLILEIFQILLSTITCYFIYSIARIIFNQKTGLVSFILTATHPGLIIYATKLSEVTLIIFLLSLTFFLIFTLGWSRIRDNIFIGFLIGVGMLTRPLALFFLPVYYLYIWLSSHKPKDALKAVFITSLSAALVIAPWTMRNYQIHKRWIFITTNSPEHFWRGNNPQATGTALAQDKQSILEKAPKELKDKLYKMNEIEQYAFFLKVTREYIKSNPFSFIRMCLRKFTYFWWFTPTLGILYPWSWAFIYKVYYALLFAFFITGAMVSLVKLNGAKKASAASLLFFFFLTSLLHSLYYLETRHRLSIEPLLSIFSSYGFILISESLRLRGIFRHPTRQ